MSRTDDVVDGIKRMILDGKLHPGDRLPIEKELAETLGVSRGPLREGIRALSILGVVDTRHGDGMYVTSLDLTRLLAPMGFAVELHGEGRGRHFHAIRRLLESEAARLAATAITETALDEAKKILDEAARIVGKSPLDHERIIETDIAFHRIIAAHTGNPVMEALIESLAGRTVRERLWRSLHDGGVDQRSHEEHVAIWRALNAHDPEGARIRMANHLIGVEESLRDAPADESDELTEQVPTD